MECSCCHLVLQNETALPHLFGSCGHNVCSNCFNIKWFCNLGRVQCPVVNCGIVSFTVLVNWAILESSLEAEEEMTVGVFNPDGCRGKTWSFLETYYTIKSQSQ